MATGSRKQQGGGGGPLHLLKADASGKFELGADALAALRAVKTPIAVAAVCGRARQGKRCGSCLVYSLNV